MNDVLSVIAARRSHRAYKDIQLTQEQLDAVLTAAVQAPSALNRQPWHYSVVQNRELIDEIDKAVHEAAMKQAADKRSPRFADSKFHVFYHAPTVIFLSAQEGYYPPIDCGIAVQTIALAAESVGLGSVILGLPREAFLGDRREELEKKLQFPAGHSFAIAIALGVPADDKPAHPVNEDRITLIR